MTLSSELKQFRLQRSRIFLDCLTLVDKEAAFFRNVDSHLLNGTKLYPRGQVSSATLLRERRRSQGNKQAYLLLVTYSSRLKVLHWTPMNYNHAFFAPDSVGVCEFEPG